MESVVDDQSPPGDPSHALQSNLHEKRKPKSLHEPTESMLASQREFERRKHEIKPEDDPFWEKRGGRNGKLIIKKEELPKKSPKSLAETVELLTPLPLNSRLLTPTQATIFGLYHKEEPPKEKHISALPATSHLLTPTKASSLGEYHPTPSPKEKPLTPRSHSGDVSSHSHQKYTPPPDSRLFDLTASCKNAKYEKKIIDTDPREDGWKSIIAPARPRSPLPVPPEIPQHHNNPYKNVKSKLFNPTIASVRQKWCDPHEGGEVIDGEGISTQDDDHREPQAASEAPHEPSASSHNHHRFSHIPSRLLEPTAAHISSQWCNRPTSPTLERKKSNSPQTVHIPAVQAKSTQAQLHSQRSKYVAPDHGDIAKKKASTRRSQSVPTLGRIYNPPPPPVTERRSSLRSPRSPASGEVASPYSNLVCDVETPFLNRARDDADDHSNLHENIDKESRLSKLFPDAAEATGDGTNPFFDATESCDDDDKKIQSPEIISDHELVAHEDIPQNADVEPEPEGKDKSGSELEQIFSDEVNPTVDDDPEVPPSDTGGVGSVP